MRVGFCCCNSESTSSAVSSLRESDKVISSMASFRDYLNNIHIGFGIKPSGRQKLINPPLY